MEIIIGNEYSFTNAYFPVGYINGILKEIWFENMPEHTRYLAEHEYFNGDTYKRLYKFIRPKIIKTKTQDLNKQLTLL